uniref:Uncharacterized protein n=1 Tax=viral metagenome TaxID=1070528 RepID=A0A6H1ZH73_9ZZZZ
MAKKKEPVKAVKKAVEKPPAPPKPNADGITLKQKFYKGVVPPAERVGQIIRELQDTAGMLHIGLELAELLPEVAGDASDLATVNKSLRSEVDVLRPQVERYQAQIKAQQEEIKYLKIRLGE